MQKFERRVPSAKDIAKYEEVRSLLRTHMASSPKDALALALKL
tara:strand:+ start:16279 stop:16407 length:129 start_codon:yes stop_codon:yes gene_type:complete